MDGIPIFSQAKSLFQYICLQPERAWETQQNFSRQCPGFSQVRSAVEWGILDDPKAALETQKECGRFVGGMANGIPVVGIGKAAIHYLFDDSEGGATALKASLHSTAVLGGGFLGFIAGGPAGAASIGPAAGAYMDIAITVVDTKVNGMVDGKARPYGFMVPFSDPTDAGKWFDAGTGVILDRFAARSAGTRADRIALARTALPTQTLVRPPMTVLMMVSNECFDFLVENVRGKAEVIILQDLLTDAGPMAVEFYVQNLSILFKDGNVIFRDATYNKHKRKKKLGNVIDFDGFIQEVLDYLDHCNRDGNRTEKDRWKRFWMKPKRVALLRSFLKLIVKS